MKTILIIALIICILNCIKIRVDIDDTYWIEKKTGRKIHAVMYDPRVGIVFHFEDNENTLYQCPLLKFIFKFEEYDGSE